MIHYHARWLFFYILLMSTSCFSSTSHHIRLFLECESAEHLREFIASLKHQTFEHWKLYATIRNWNEYTRAQALFSEPTMKDRVVLLDGSHPIVFKAHDITLGSLQRLVIPTTLADIAQKYVHLFE